MTELQADTYERLIFIRHGRILIRGTKEWDDREAARREIGCNCLSFGTIGDSIKTRARTALLTTRRQRRKIMPLHLLTY